MVKVHINPRNAQQSELSITVPSGHMAVILPCNTDDPKQSPKMNLIGTSGGNKETESVITLPDNSTRNLFVNANVGYFRERK